MLLSRTPSCRIGFVIPAAVAAWISVAAEWSPAAALEPEVVVADASSVAKGHAAGGPIDGDRFSADGDRAWQGRPGEKSWWWQVRFPQERALGAILQIHGDSATVFSNAPRTYVWQTSLDGQTWDDLEETRIDVERRSFRLHRLQTVRRCRYARLSILAAAGEAPTLREVEFYDAPDAAVRFPAWIVVVDTTGEAKITSEGSAFIPLAQSCQGYENLVAQRVRLADFDDQLVVAEPRPLCAFLSGNFQDWCQQDRENWRGMQQVLEQGRLPMWASCGGAQGLAILAETGVDRPWDCPHCRDPLHPKLPIYTHIGHTSASPLKCGDYSACVFERGPFQVRQLAADPVFAGLAREFRSTESHCGQIEWPPAGWMLIATAGEGGLTKTQCLRVKDRYIYAAQFHIELDGTLDSSRTIMANFLRLAGDWGGYNAEGKPVDAPRVFAAATREPAVRKASPSVAAQRCVTLSRRARPLSRGGFRRIARRVR